MNNPKNLIKECLVCTLLAPPRGGPGQMMDIYSRGSTANLYRKHIHMRTNQRMQATAFPAGDGLSWSGLCWTGCFAGTIRAVPGLHIGMKTM